MIVRLLTSICFLILIGAGGFAQEQFVQLTYFDQLTWSEDGNQLAFRSILLDESRPDQLKANILIKDLNQDQLICSDPQPERFVISQDKKYLLFSSIYGLYLMSLDEPAQTTQIYFRNPAASWWFQDFGFLKKKSTIYIDRYEQESNQVTREYYRLPESKTKTTFISWVGGEKVKKIRSAAFNLPLDELRGNQLPEIKLKNAMIKFQPQTVAGDYQLIYQSVSPKAVPEILLKDSRPRLLSLNPDQTEIIVSVFQATQHQTYRFSINSKKLIQLETSRYFSIAWLDNSRYICITEDGLFIRNLALTINQKLNQWRLPAWCQSINLSFPQYELQIGFEPDKKIAEQISVRLLKAGYFARIKYFKDQKKDGFRIRVGGFADKQQAQAAGSKLKNMGFEFWIDQISDLYDYFNSQHQVERSAFNHQNEAIIEYKFDNYLRSRIVLKASNKIDRTIVDEMNNIPMRALW